jgi:hypothetical protein
MTFLRRERRVTEQSRCEHSIRSKEWIPDEEDEYGNGGEWVERYTSTCVDIDLHRFKCTQCGEVMYYSGRARDHYEGKGHDEFIHHSNREHLKRKSDG